jgi:hypothetical protein
LALISKQTTGWLTFPSKQPAGFNFPVNSRLAYISQQTAGWLQFPADSRLASISQHTVYCGKNSRIFRNATDQTLPVTEYSEIDKLI